MTARFSWNQGNTRGHRPRLTADLLFLGQALKARDYILDLCLTCDRQHRLLVISASAAQRPLTCCVFPDLCGRQRPHPVISPPGMLGNVQFLQFSCAVHSSGTGPCDVPARYSHQRLVLVFSRHITVVNAQFWRFPCSLRSSAFSFCVFSACYSGRRSFLAL
jgi:hypothetical protein